MKKIMKAAGLLAVGLASLAMISCAPKTFNAKVDWAGSIASSYLDLNKDQEAAMDPLLATAKQVYPEFKTYKDTLQTTLKSELQNSTFNANRVKDELKPLEARLMVLSDQVVIDFAAFYQTLTPKQKEKITSHENGRFERRTHHFGDHWGRNRDGDSAAHPSFQDFDLQPEQVTALKKLASGIAADSIDVMLANQQLRKMIKEELTANSFNAEKVSAKLKESISLVFASVYRHLPDYADFHKQLDAKQREILVQMVDRMDERSKNEGL